VLSKFFRTHSSASSSHRLAIIFHCEFSQNRAPKSYKFFRSLDRLRNQANYPQLSFPELCVLDGGYKKFVRDYPQHCARTPLTDLGNVQPTAAAGPGLYISMWDEEYTAECKTRTAAHRKSWNTNKLLASDLINTPCVSAKKAPRHNAAAAEDMLCSSSKKSPASRGLKRSAADASPDHLLAGGGAAASFTPSGRSNSNPEDGSGGEGRRFRGRTNLFAPFRSGGLFASPMRNDGAEGGSQADHGRTRGSGSAMMMSGLSPLPSFELLSTPAPHTPAVDSDVLMAIQPVPFPMMCSPDKQ
jgi:hypothetical protein